MPCHYLDLGDGALARVQGEPTTDPRAVDALRRVMRAAGEEIDARELREREALERDRRAAREAAATGKILCSACGCQTNPLEDLCWSCEKPPGLGGGLVEPPYARLYELSVEALRERRQRTEAGP
jgi:hypothetical protein